MFRYILLIIFSFFLSVHFGSAATDINDQINVRDTSIENGSVNNHLLSDFMTIDLQSFFFDAPDSGEDGIYTTFTTLAFQIKNFFIIIAVLFLIIGVLKLLFSPAGDEDIKKWRRNILWVTVGIFVMQISFSIWNVLILGDIYDKVGGALGYAFWIKVFSPIVNLLQMLAAFGFIAMMFYAFYTIVTGGGDEEKLKKGKSTVIYAIVGFLLIKIPQTLINAIYGSESTSCIGSGYSTAGCVVENPNLSGGITIIANIFTFFNTFLSILCVILIIYAGWLVVMSGGEEEKLKKAKNIILYIVIGLMILVASHAIFRFFILQG